MLTEARIRGIPTAATAIAVMPIQAMLPAWRTTRRAQASSVAIVRWAAPLDGTIGQRSKMPGTTRNSIARVSMTPMAAWNPNTRIGSSSLTTSDARPTAVVPADRLQGSQPKRIARQATPARPPVASESMR